MKKSILLIIALILSVTLLSACGKATYEPSPIDETVDKCPICNMQVADDQFAVEIILKNRKALKFDDLGDLFVWREDNDSDQIGEQFVRDYNSKEWIKLSDASYVFDKSIRTPMAYNVISFKEKKDAEAFIRNEGKGQLLSGDDLLTRKWEPNEEMMKSMMESMANEKMDEKYGKNSTGGMDEMKSDTQ